MPLPLAAGAAAPVAAGLGAGLTGGVARTLAVAGGRGMLGNIFRSGAGNLFQYVRRGMGGAVPEAAGDPKAQTGLKLFTPHSANAANGTALGDLNAALGEIDQFLPRFGHSITVNVKGGPRADLRRCWYLALSACFGRYKRGLTSVWGRSINAQWNITGKEVSVTLAYTFTGRVDNTQGALMDESGLSFIQRGPDQVTIGGGFPRWMWTSRQIMSSGIRGWGLATGPLGVAFMLSGGGLRAIELGGGGYDIDDKANGAAQKLNLAGKGIILSSRRNSVDARSLFLPWYVDHDTARAQQPVAARVFQPYRTRPAPNIFRELPVRPAGAGTAFTPAGERLPIRAIMPGVGETTDYVVRGGLFGGVPTLPDDGRVITTGEKNDARVQPPKPPVDGLSRGHPLAMIVAVLSEPGVLVDVPIESGNTLGSGGVYAYKPGESIDGYAFWGQRVVTGQLPPSITTDALNFLTKSDNASIRTEVPADVVNIAN